MVDENKSFDEMTPDEVAERSKKNVGRGVEKVARSMEKPGDQAERTKGGTKDALHRVGATTREIGGAAAAEAARTKDSVQDAADE